MALTTRKVIGGVLAVVVVLTVPGLLIWRQVSNSNPCRKYEFLRSGLSEDALFLTPLLRSNSVTEARDRALVPNWKGVDSYSGFITVQETSNSNLFFWFFPASASNASAPAPLILYLQGGPGMSSMFGLFLETGPFSVNPANNIERRDFSWTTAHSVLYVDSPVDTGYSFTDDPESLARGQADVSRDLYEFLLQFFQLFPDYQEAGFYIAGTSYSGKYIPVLALKIHLENEQDPRVRINLKGLAIGGGYFEAELQDKFADFGYYLGFIDERQRAQGLEQEARVLELVQARNFDEARNVSLSHKRSMTTEGTGWTNFLSGNALQLDDPPNFWNFNDFLSSNCIKQGLHVGLNRTYYAIGSASKYFDKADFYYSTRTELERLLDAGYRVLFFAGQFDLVVNHMGISKFLNSLTWNRTEEYLRAERKSWTIDGTVGGYVKEVKGMTYLLIRNTGHMPCADKPDWCLDMITRFTTGSSFS